MTSPPHSNALALSEILQHVGKDHRQVLRAFVLLHREVMADPSGLSQAEAEMIALVTSNINHCAHCVDVHYAKLLPLVLGTKPQGFAAELLVDPLPTSLSTRERALLAYTMKLALAPGEVATNDLLALREAGLSDPEIEHATLVAASLNFTNRVAMIVAAIIQTAPSLH